MQDTEGTRSRINQVNRATIGHVDTESDSRRGRDQTVGTLDRCESWRIDYRDTVAMHLLRGSQAVWSKAQFIPQQLLVPAGEALDRLVTVHPNIDLRVPQDEGVN